VLRHAKLFLVLALASAAAARASTIELQAGNTATVPFSLIDNRIFVAVSINGSKPYQFVFDTGGSNILDPAVAKELGLKLEEDGEAWGAGAATQRAWRTHVKDARLPGVAMRDHEFRVISLEPVRHAIGFRRLDGIVGRELFERFAIMIDYDGATLTFSDLTTWTPSPAFGPPKPLQFVDGIPALPATIDGISGTFILDTGDRSSLTLFGPFVEKHKLRSKYANKISLITGWGIGGPIPADVTRAKAFTLGGHTMSGIVTRMPHLKTGAFAMSEAAGSVGTGVFKRFRIVFDYPRKRIFMAPGAAFAAHDPADRSGLWLALADAGFKVMSVAAGSPAAEAGIRVDDIITAVNGKPASDIFLVDLRDKLKRAPAGTKIRFSLKSGTTARDVTITLRDLL
jgi:hypothetical protein